LLSIKSIKETAGGRGGKREKKNEKEKRNPSLGSLTLAREKKLPDFQRKGTAIEIR